MHWHARLFIDKLQLDPHVPKQVLLCPFHVDSGKSLSVDLDKGVWYCHGGCDEPKGGGVVEFMIKWWWLTEKQRVPKRDAKLRVRKLLTHGFSFQSAQQLSRELLVQDLRRFTPRAGYRYASRLHARQSVIDQIHASCQGTPPPPTDWRWPALEALYKELTWFATAADVCAQGRITSELVGVYQDAQQRDLWNSIREQERDALLAEERAERRRREQERSSRPVARTPVRQTVRQPCRELPSETIPRTPATIRTPIR